MGSYGTAVEKIDDPDDFRIVNVTMTSLSFDLTMLLGFETSVCSTASTGLPGRLARLIVGFKF